MPRVRSVSGTTYARRAAAAQDSYRDGVLNPRNDWEKATVDASDRMKAATIKSLDSGSFAKGVRKAGNATWQKNASELGPSRFASGTEAAATKWEDGVRPYIETIERTTLPPRYPKGDPRNLERVKVMADVLHRQKSGTPK